jgi:transcriptional regulator with XRE-family HTH domain
MSDAMTAIADKVRGVAEEKRSKQEHVAGILGISRQAVSQRYTAKVPFTAPEVHRLASVWNVPIARLFPDPQITFVPEATPPAVSVTEAPATPVLDAVPDPGVEGGGVSASALVSGSGAEDSSAA